MDTWKRAVVVAFELAEDALARNCQLSANRFRAFSSNDVFLRRAWALPRVLAVGRTHLLPMPLAGSQ